MIGVGFQKIISPSEQQVKVVGKNLDFSLILGTILGTILGLDLLNC